jgi:hypothetical protein
MATPGRKAAGDKDKTDALAQMNLTKILRAYLHQMAEEVSGYKAFLLDKDTMRVCSTLYGRTELAEHSLVHIERIDGNDGAEHINLKVSFRSRALEPHLLCFSMQTASGRLCLHVHDYAPQQAPSGTSQRAPDNWKENRL